MAREAFPAKEHAYRIASPTYHHDLAPNVSIDAVRWGSRTYNLRTNSLGFKDRRVRTVPLTTDQHRLLFIGDSFTEGIGVGYEHTFVGLIDMDRLYTLLQAHDISLTVAVYPWQDQIIRGACIPNR